MTFRYRQLESSPSELRDVCKKDWDLQFIVPDQNPCISSICFDGEQPIGLAVAYKGIGSTLYISDILVTKCHQRKGIGTELLRMLEEVARQKGFSSLTLTVHEKNSTAKGLYCKMGFNRLGLQRRPYENWSKNIQ